MALIDKAAIDGNFTQAHPRRAQQVRGFLYLALEQPFVLWHSRADLEGAGKIRRR